MASIEGFRAHVYGADMTTPCSESDVVKMIIEMLLGSSNDIFGHVQKPVDKLYCIPESSNQNNIGIQVFHVTPFGLHTRLENLSSTLVHGILKWFGQLGSQLYICRKFALYSRNSTVSTNQQTQLTSAVLDTLRSSISALLSSVEEALCDFEQKVLELPLSEGKAKLHTRLEYNRRITLIALYQRCLPWQSMFQSLAGIVCSTMPVSALPSLTPTPAPPTLSAEQTPSKQQTPTYHSSAYAPSASAVDAVFEKLVVRGILQDVGEMLALGGLVDIHPSMRLLTDGMNSSRNKSGSTATEMRRNGDCTESTEPRLVPDSVAPIRQSYCTVDVSLTLQLPTLHRSGYYLYAKLFFSAMLEKYLTNLVSMVWQQQKPQNHTSVKDSDTVYSANNTNHYSAYDTPVTRRSLTSVVNTPDASNKTHLNYPEGAIKTIFSTPMSNKTLQTQDAGAIDGMLQMLTVFGMNRHTNRNVSKSKANGVNSAYSVNSVGMNTLAVRRKQRRVVTLLQQTRDLIAQSSQYEVPNFLLPITQEAMVSARDILILQKSHIQRQNPSYNLSRLKKLIEESVQEYRRALLPYHYSVDNNNIPTTTTGSRVTTATSVTKLHKSITHTTVLPLLSRSESNDPVVSYLLTGRSVKIVGVRTPITTTNDTIDTSHGGNNTHHSITRSITATPTATTATNTTSSVHSDTLASYHGGGITSNSDYLGPLLAQRAAQLSVAKELVTSVNTITAGSATDKDNNSTDFGLRAVQKYPNKRAPEIVPLSELLCYATATTTVQVSLLHRLKEHLHTARADAALYVLKTHQLQVNLRYIRDVFLLGQPDFYAPIRELCLNVTDWKSRLADSSDRNTRKGSNMYNRMSSMFIGEAITGVMMDKAPSCGVRYLSVQVKSSHKAPSNDTGSHNKDNTRVGMGSTSFATKKQTTSSVVPLQAVLSSYLSTMTTSSTLFTNPTATTTTHSDNDVTELFATITNLHIHLLHEWPLTSFVDASLYPALNNNMRFLLLLTASRWAAEYWWMDAISNHSLNTTAYTSTSPTTHTNTNAGSDSSPVDYLDDVLQAKRNCRAGLAVFLHTITAVNNIFMAHIHRTLWPAFETALEAHHTSLLAMQYELHSVLQLIDASLTLLRDQVLSIVVKGFSASCAMRAAISLEYAEIAPIEAQNQAFQAQYAQQRQSTQKASIKHKKNEPKPRNPRVEMKNTASTTDTEECPKIRYVTSAAVLVAFRAAEDAYADLKYAVSDLKNTVVQEVRRNTRTGAVGRECKAMEELLMYLSA